MGPTGDCKEKVCDNSAQDCNYTSCNWKDRLSCYLEVWRAEGLWPPQKRTTPCQRGLKPKSFGQMEVGFRNLISPSLSSHLACFLYFMSSLHLSLFWCLCCIRGKCWLNVSLYILQRRTTLFFLCLNRPWDLWVACCLLPMTNTVWKEQHAISNDFFHSGNDWIRNPGTRKQAAWVSF